MAEVQTPTELARRLFAKPPSLQVRRGERHVLNAVFEPYSSPARICHWTRLRC